MSDDNVTIWGSSIKFGRKPENGELLIGDGSGFKLSSITAGSNISITNSSGGITINATTDVSGFVPETRTLTAGVGLSGGGDLSADRTFDLENTAVTPGSYSLASITVDQQGRITSASNGSVGTFTLIETITATSGTTKTTTASFAGYSQIFIAGENISSSGTASMILTVQLSGDNGSTWTLAGNISQSFSSSSEHYVYLNIPYPNGSAPFKSVFGQAYTETVGNGSAATVVGYMAVLSVVTNVRLAFAGGLSFDGVNGVFKVYGVT